MWHDEPEVVSFLAEARRACAAPAVVVELGSYQMHDHDPRGRWPAAQWFGIDARPGPGVDLVGLAHEAIWRIPAWHGGDVVVLSVSALEHDPHWRATLGAARDLARAQGGIVAVTCAGPGWEPHELECAPGGPWYENRTSGEIADVLLADGGADRCTAWDSLRSCAPHWVRSNVIATYRRAT